MSNVARDERILAPLDAPARLKNALRPRAQRFMRLSILKLDIDDACTLHA